MLPRKTLGIDKIMRRELKAGVTNARCVREFYEIRNANSFRGS